MKATERPVPLPGPKEVLIKMLAVSLNACGRLGLQLNGSLRSLITEGLEPAQPMQINTA